jgi:hypothetical protein
VQQVGVRRETLHHEALYRLGNEPDEYNHPPVEGPLAGVGQRSRSKKSHDGTL